VWIPRRRCSWERWRSINEQGLHGALAWNLLELYNEAVREIGRERWVLVIDLARRIPKDSRLFYDFVHFNNDGSAAVRWHCL
jgi:hypothetical protein